MSLDRSTVARIANLARIDVPDDQQEPLARELSNLLLWVEQLREVDTDGVEPLRMIMPLPPRWREDSVTDGGHADVVTANAPAALDGFFVVPKVVE
ncbi:aspartyl/glutamyl-tRNA(Asn/Gln) amidotransferase subunit C [Arboricoccus pini]|uniref:Aspartyl/glutamyl-tRNA(Asn/Gln) amidotransferase subunit C n=1 Tax=Arboricoccus pini TaxID=1963835 RepID=A0A212R6Q7_9PROT|nr:Asp-tRNA(Asn)/Glu-tRNA(Gln) amidotransferase subunit GatC [Arboricoccus pini]SNB67876.1 aspartyl/glutamyl-tRNA(Asn/Gln) amidotransferase subunit C [Arboricoccus pini]